MKEITLDSVGRIVWVAKEVEEFFPEAAASTPA